MVGLEWINGVLVDVDALPVFQGMTGHVYAYRDGKTFVLMDVSTHAYVHHNYVAFVQTERDTDECVEYMYPMDTPEESIAAATAAGHVVRRFDI